MKKRILIFVGLLILVSFLYAKPQNKNQSYNKRIDLLYENRQRETKITNYSENGDFLCKKNLIIYNNSNNNIAFSVYGKRDVDSKKIYLFSMPVPAHKNGKMDCSNSFVNYKYIIFESHYSIIDFERIYSKKEDLYLEIKDSKFLSPLQKLDDAQKEEISKELVLAGSNNLPIGIHSFFFDYDIFSSHKCLFGRSLDEDVIISFHNTSNKIYKKVIFYAVPYDKDGTALKCAITGQSKKALEIERIIKPGESFSDTMVQVWHAKQIYDCELDSVLIIYSDNTNLLLKGKALEETMDFEPQKVVLYKDDNVVVSIYYYLKNLYINAESKNKDITDISVSMNAEDIYDTNLFKLSHIDAETHKFSDTPSFTEKIYYSNSKNIILTKIQNIKIVYKFKNGNNKVFIVEDEALNELLRHFSYYVNTLGLTDLDGV